MQDEKGKEEFKFINEIGEEAERLTDTCYEILKPDKDGQVDTVRLCFDIPKAYIVLAAWCNIKRKQRRHGNEKHSALMYPEHPETINKNIKAHAKNYIHLLLDYALDVETLHYLACKEHPILFEVPEQERNEYQQEKKKQDLDDEIPF